MRTSKKVAGTTVKSRVLKLLEDGKIMTATEAAHQTGSHWSTTSSLLKKLLDKGVVDRIPNFGPLKGYGYFLKKNWKKIGKVRPVKDDVPFGVSDGEDRELRRQRAEKTRPAQKSDNPYSAYSCPSCGQSRNGYESHYCCTHPRMVSGPNGGHCPDCSYAYDI